MGKISELTSALKIFASGKEDLIGLDIGSYAVKAVYITGGEKACQVKAWGYEPYNFKPNTNPAEKKALMAKAVRKMLSAAGISQKSVCVAVSGNSVIVRYVKVPFMAHMDLEARLAIEAEPFIPFDIHEVHLGFHKIRDVKEEGLKKMEIILVAAKKEIVDTKMEIVNAAGLNPLIIDVDNFALDGVCARMESVKAEKPEKDKSARKNDGADDSAEKHGATLVINMGHKVTNLVIIENGITRVARDIFIAGASFNKAISKSLTVEIDKADELKKEHGLKFAALEPASARESFREEDITIPSGHSSKPPVAAELNAEPAPLPAVSTGEAVSGVLYEVLKDLIVEVRRSVDFYYSQGSER
ncbi:MAG: type IV pilus assembly protein PilM, partial [Elusimicrobiaceae bacterium]